LETGCGLFIFEACKAKITTKAQRHQELQENGNHEWDESGESELG
jgi:hypothetical protein